MVNVTLWSCTRHHDSHHQGVTTKTILYSSCVGVITTELLRYPRHRSLLAPITTLHSTFHITPSQHHSITTTRKTRTTHHTQCTTPHPSNKPPLRSRTSPYAHQFRPPYQTQTLQTPRRYGSPSFSYSRSSYGLCHMCTTISGLVRGTSRYGCEMGKENRMVGGGFWDVGM